MNGMFCCNELLYTKIMLEMKVHIDDTGVRSIHVMKMEFVRFDIAVFMLYHS